MVILALRMAVFLILWHVQRIYAQSYRTLEFSLDL